MENKQTLYPVLGVDPAANAEEIQRAVKQVGLQHHPDHGGEESAFVEVQTVYEILSDARKQRIYDRFGKEGLEESDLGLFTAEFRKGAFALRGGVEGSSAAGRGSEAKEALEEEPPKGPCFFIAGSCLGDSMCRAGL